ncbi:MAG: polyprenol monophosphomannose synthase [Candidatus Altiarchaeota archaeon]
MKPIVMLPTYNERGNITRIIKSVLSQDERLEVLVVDDDSPDGTDELVAELAKDDDRIHLLVRTGVRGRASAGVAGFKHALENGYDVVVEMDADFSHDPKYIPLLLENIGDADVVIGSRYVDGGDTEHKIFIQNMLSKMSNMFNKVVLGLGVHDSSGGFKCYRREVLEALDLDNFVSTGYSVGAEILYRCMKAGFSMREVPIIFKPRASGSSKLNWNIILKYPIDVLRLRMSV